MSAIEPSQFIWSLIQSLENMAIPYMITGSVASSYYGEPRSTNDTDIIIDPDESKLKCLVDSLQYKAMAEWTPALDALRKRSMFNVIDYETNEKVDFIIQKRSEFDQNVFERRMLGVINGRNVFLVSPEDSILSKMQWSNNTLSEVQLRDIVGTMLVQWDDLDWNYIERWSGTLGVGKFYDKAKTEAKMRR